MYESSLYFWFGSADNMADDGVSMESDHTMQHFFYKVENLLRVYCYIFSFSPIFNGKGVKNPQHACVSNTLLPLVFIKAIYKMYASLPKIQSSLTNYSQW